MNRLQEQIIKASQDYYENGSSAISDEKFDLMLEELREQNPDDPLLTAVGHGYDVEQDSTFGDKVAHLYGPAGSLEKCHDYKEYRKFMNSDDEIWASLKLDGMSVVLYYQKGKLLPALTRGSGLGEIGVDITNRIQHIDSSVLQLADKTFTGAVRGELVMKFSQFDRLKDIDSTASNPRNSTVGIVKAKNDLRPELLNLIDIVVYNVVGITGNTTLYGMLNSQWDATYYSQAYVWLTQNFNHVVPAEVINFRESTFIDEMNKLRDKWYGVWPADGIVLSMKKAEVTSTDDKHYIKYPAVAFKYPAQAIESKVTNIDWNLSKTKYLIPRINFETVDIDGTSVSWAHGDNAKSILDRKIGPGAVVEVVKRGAVIPHVESVIQPSDETTLPTVCPCCGTPLTWVGMQLACPNIECSDADVKDLLVWCKYIAPIDGLGDILKLKFFGQYLGEEHISISDVYGAALPVKSLGSQWNLFCDMYELLRNRQVKLVDAIKALNIPRISDVNAEKLAKYPQIIKYLAEGIAYTFTTQERKDIGNANCDSIEANSRKFLRLKHIYQNIDWSVEADVVVKGKVVITGKLSVKREAFEAELKSKGYLTAGSVTKDTMCLITDNPSSGTSKNLQADKLGVLKLTETEFRTRYLN